MASLASRQNMETSSAPQRRALRAASMATLPPPMTTVRFAAGVCSFSATAYRKSTAVNTPSASSPGTPALRPPWQPMAM